MGIQADIKWIKTELSNVRDPHLIEAFKQMLAYRKLKETPLSETDAALSVALDRAILQAESGKVKPHNEIRKKYDKWL